MTDRTAWNLAGLSRSYRGVPIDQLPAEVRQALLRAGKIRRDQDGTLVALSAELEEEPDVLEYEEQVPTLTVEMTQAEQEAFALALADQGGYGDELRATLAHFDAIEAGYAPVHSHDPVEQDDGLISRLELSQAEDAFAVQLGASDRDGLGGTDFAQDTADGTAAVEALRYVQLHQNMTRSGPPVPEEFRRSLEPWGYGDDFSAVPLSRTDVAAAVDQMSEFSNSIPEAASTWYDPARDGEGRDGQGGSSMAGERAMALSRPTRRSAGSSSAVMAVPGGSPAGGHGAGR